MLYENLSHVFRVLISQLSCMEIPDTIQDALKVPEWKDAGNKEMKTLENNSTWELVNLPRRKTIVGCGATGYLQLSINQYYS